jgi:hypothetical protein
MKSRMMRLRDAVRVLADTVAIGRALEDGRITPAQAREAINQMPTASQMRTGSPNISREEAPGIEHISAVGDDEVVAV